MSLLGILAGISVLLTCTMFAIKQVMLGFACAIFWMITGAQAYTLSEATWDIYYFIFIACSLGMTLLCVLGMFGLKDKTEETMGKWDEEPYIDEAGGNPKDLPKENTLSRSDKIRKRAGLRRKAVRSLGQKRK